MLTVEQAEETIRALEGRAATYRDKLALNEAKVVSACCAAGRQISEEVLRAAAGRMTEWGGADAALTAHVMAFEYEPDWRKKLVTDAALDALRVVKAVEASAPLAMAAE